MRTEILSLATCPVAHFCNHFNLVFALLILMSRFNSINFYQNRLEIKLFLKKNTKILSAVAPRLRASGDPNRLRRLGLRP